MKGAVPRPRIPADERIYGETDRVGFGGLGGEARGERGRQRRSAAMERRKNGELAVSGRIRAGDLLIGRAGGRGSISRWCIGKDWSAMNSKRIGRGEGTRRVPRGQSWL